MLHPLGGRLADQRSVVASHIVDDSLVKSVATDTDRLGIDDAV